MTLSLRVDGDRWRKHLRSVASEVEGLVPVAKGNGYGLGVGRLARKAEWLGVDTMAVGVYDELPEVLTRFAGDVVVLNPWRPFLSSAVEALTIADSRRIIHTVGRAEDLIALRDSETHPRVLLEVMTSMRRHGIEPKDFAASAAAANGLRCEGISIHLPLAGPHNLTEAQALIASIKLSLLALGSPTVWVSHLSQQQVAALRQTHPELRIRTRSGTALWLGDDGALQVTSTVLDSHTISAGQVFGYRRRKAPKSGTILIVSGGTAHGIGLESPTGELSARTRAATVARGSLDAMGRVKSPFLIGGVQPMFAEPPHMQSSMLFLPRGANVPEVGDEISARVRHTATTFDRVEIL